MSGLLTFSVPTDDGTAVSEETSQKVLVFFSICILVITAFGFGIGSV